jgi:hypothetical protein
VPILRLLQGRVFEPEVVNAMVTAFEDVLCELKLTDRGDPIVERVAKISLNVRNAGCATRPTFGIARCRPSWRAE